MDIVSIKQTGIESVTATLTAEEAQLLINLHHYHLAGNPRGYRGVFDNIVRALKGAGMEVTKDPARGSGDICFPNTKEDC